MLALDMADGTFSRPNLELEIHSSTLNNINALEVSPPR